MFVADSYVHDSLKFLSNNRHFQSCRVSPNRRWRMLFCYVLLTCWGWGRAHQKPALRANDVGRIQKTIESVVTHVGLTQLSVDSFLRLADDDDDMDRSCLMKCASACL